MDDYQQDGRMDRLDPKHLEMEAWQSVAAALRGLDRAGQERVMRSIATLLEIDLGYSLVKPAHATALPASSLSDTQSIPHASFSGSEERNLSAKEFLHQKRPTTDVDRIACLAYYLTHYRDVSYFKTIDLSQLNTEAAQIKFSNAAKAVDNASQAGLLVPAVKGHKQLSAIGELYVRELPDKAAARSAIEGYKRKRRKPNSSSQNRNVSSGEI